MKAYLLVEGSSDQVLFKRLLPAEIGRATAIVAAGGRSNITSKARSLLVLKQTPVAVVADTDTVETSAVERQRESLEELVESAAAGIPYKVILAVPEIESWFFMVPEVLERLSHKQLSSEQCELGKLRPKEVLRQLFRDQVSWSIDKMVGELNEAEVEKLRETDSGKELIEFLTEQVNRTSEPSPT